MNVVYLPGSSKANQPWIRDLSQELRTVLRRSYVHDYLHWDTDSQSIEYDLELAIVSEKAVDYEPYTVVAKSAGILLALKGMYEGALRPRKCVFLGLPLGYIKESDLPVSEWVQHTSIPCLLLQNSDDPVGSYEQVSKYIDQIDGRHIVHKEMTGDSHDYTNFNAIRTEVTAFI